MKNTNENKKIWSRELLPSRNETETPSKMCEEKNVEDNDQDEREKGLRTAKIMQTGKKKENTR